VKNLKIKFIWGGSRAIPGRWYLGLFGLYDRGEGRRGRGIAISMRGILSWSAGLALAAYMAGATALFWMWERNPYSLLTYGDAVLYPLRQQTIGEKKGQAFIARGADAFRERKFHDAAMLLRLGLARYPRDLRARLMLAQYYFMANQRPMAAQVLEEGLTDEYPGRAYLEALFGAAEQGDDFQKIIAVADRYRERLRGSEDSRLEFRWLMGRQFAALAAAGRHEVALERAQAEVSGDFAWEHRVLALLSLGRTGEALAALAEWRETPGADRRTVLRLNIRALREAKRFDEMDAAIQTLRDLNPAEPPPAVYGVVQRALAGRETAADEALDDYLFRFGGSARNLQLLAEPLAEIGDRRRLERCIAAALERGYPPGRFQVLLVETLVNQGDWAAANRILTSIPPPTGREAAQGEVWRALMQRLIDVGATPSDAAQIELLEFLRGRPWPVQTFRRSIETLRLAGRLDAARDAIAMATRAFPTSPWVQTQADEVAAAIAARDMPVVPVAPVAVRLPGEAIFFGQLDGAIEAGRWADAARQVSEARGARPAPNWVAANEPRLRLAQVRIGRGLADRSTMVGSARLYLNGSDERSNRILELAREFHAAGDPGAAQAVTREVLSRTPGYPPAQRLLAEWEPKPEEKKEPGGGAP